MPDLSLPATELPDLSYASLLQLQSPYDSYQSQNLKHLIHSLRQKRIAVFSPLFTSIRENIFLAELGIEPHQCHILGAETCFEKEVWQQYSEIYDWFLFLPVAEPLGQMIDLEECIYTIRQLPKSPEIAVEVTALLFAEPFYMEDWKIDLVFYNCCNDSRFSDAWAVYKSETGTSTANTEIEALLPWRRWQIIHQRARKFRRGIEASSTAALIKDSMNGLAFTAFTAENEFLNRLTACNIQYGKSIEAGKTATYWLYHTHEEFDRILTTLFPEP